MPWGSVLRAGVFWGKPFSCQGLAAFLSCARGATMAGVTHLQHCRMLLGSHQLLPMQVAFGDSF